MNATTPARAERNEAYGDSGTAAQAVPRAMAHRGTVGASLCWLLLLVAAYFIPRGQYPNPDSHLALTYALVEQHTVRIDHYLEMSGTRTPLIDKAVYCGSRTDVRTCKQYISDKDPGVSLLAAVAYAALRPFLPAGFAGTQPGADRFVLRWLLTLLTISVPCALFLGLYWRFLSALAGPAAALLVTIGYGFGSNALPFSTLMFSHALSAALLFTAFTLLFRSIHSGARETSARDLLRSWRPFLGGVLAAYAVECEYPAAIVAGLLGLYALSAAARRGVRLPVAYAFGAVVGVLPLLVYNLATFGTVLSQGYLHLTDPYYAAGMARGILGVGFPRWDAVWGTTFSPYRGMFVLSPWLLLAFPGLVRMWHGRYRHEALLCAAISVCYFTFQSGYAFWDGGASVGPRHFLPALPFFALPVLFCLDGARMRRIAAILVGVAVIMMLLIVATRPTYPMGLQLPFWNETLRDLAHGKLQNNWGMLLVSGPLSLVPLLLGLVLLGRQLLRRLPRQAITENLQSGNAAVTAQAYAQEVSAPVLTAGVKAGEAAVNHLEPYVYGTPKGGAQS